MKWVSFNNKLKIDVLLLKLTVIIVSKICWSVYALELYRSVASKSCFQFHANNSSNSFGRIFIDGNYFFVVYPILAHFAYQ